MTNEKMREEFEEWAITQGLDVYRSVFTNEYLYSAQNLAWAAWKASRENIEVELPEKCPELTIYNMALDDVKQKLTEHGFKVR